VLLCAYTFVGLLTSDRVGQAIGYPTFVARVGVSVFIAYGIVVHIAQETYGRQVEFPRGWWPFPYRLLMASHRFGLPTIIMIIILLGAVHGRDFFGVWLGGFIDLFLPPYGWPHFEPPTPEEATYRLLMTVVNGVGGVALYWAIKINWRAFPLMFINAFLIVLVDSLTSLLTPFVNVVREILQASS